LNTEGDIPKKNFKRISMKKNDENKNTINIPENFSKQVEADEKRSMHKSITNNVFNSDWEKNKKNTIKEIYEKKFHRIDTPKKIKLMNQASVLFDDAFYQNTFQGKIIFKKNFYFLFSFLFQFYFHLILLDYKMEDVNMTIVPIKENNKENSGKSSNTESYVLDPGFFKREMAKKGY
jgi:hypothetical protein